MAKKEEKNPAQENAGEKTKKETKSKKSTGTKKTSSKKSTGTKKPTTEKAENMVEKAVNSAESQAAATEKAVDKIAPKQNKVAKNITIEDSVSKGVTAHNIDDLIAGMPDAPEMPEINEESKMPETTNIDELPAPQQTPMSQNEMAKVKKELENYGASIGSTISNHFKMRMFGKIPFAEIKETITLASKEYNYDIKRTAKGVYINVTRDENTIRVPSNPNSFFAIEE